jgi:hypothetical protein
VLLDLWQIASDPPPHWFGEVAATELERLRELAGELRVYELWFNAEYQSLAGNEGALVRVRPGESVKEAFMRLLLREAERQRNMREVARERHAERPSN